MKIKPPHLSSRALFIPLITILAACNSDMSVDSYFPVPANRTMAPVIEKVELVDKNLVVRWSKIEGAQKYHLYYGLKSGVAVGLSDGVVQVRGESGAVEGVKEYTDYYFMVTSFNDIGLESEPSDEFRYAAPAPPPPPAPTPTPGVPGAPIGDCTKTHTLAGHTPVWTYNQCAPVSGIRIDQNTIGADGSALGGRSINVGRASFSVQGASNAQYNPTFSLVFLALMKAYGNGGGEANWHWLSFGNGSGLEFRLVVQRFDGTCPKFCDHSQQEFGISFDNPADAWTWDCWWNTADVSCDIFKNGNYFTTLAVPTKGPYNTLNYFGLGNQATSGYAGLAGKFSNIRLTIFQ